MVRSEGHIYFLTDSTLLIDLWREQRHPGPATRFARQRAQAVVGLPWVAKGEFLRGVAVAGQGVEKAARFLLQFIVVWPTTVREMKLPLVTRNAADFNQVPDIRIVDYSQGEE